MLPEWFPFLMTAAVVPFVVLSALKAWRGEFRPSPVTWTLWAAAPMIAGVASIGEGAGTSSVSMIGAGLGPLLILGASLAGPHRADRWPVTPFDLSCGAFAVAGLVGWWMTGSGVVAVVFAVAADAAAAVPTFRKAFTTPESETPVSYVAGIVTGLTALATLTVWSAANWLFPLWLVVLNVSLIAVITFPRRSSDTSIAPEAT